MHDVQLGAEVLPRAGERSLPADSVAAAAQLHLCTSTTTPICQAVFISIQFVAPPGSF